MGAHRRGVRSALAATLALTLAAAARAAIPWPAGGAPLCTFPGREYPLVQSRDLTLDVLTARLTFGFFYGDDDTPLFIPGVVGVYPPSQCPAATTHVPVVRPREAAAAGLSAGWPSPNRWIAPAYVWIEGSGSDERIRVEVDAWEFFRWTIDDGAFVRHHPRMAGGGPLFENDTSVVVVWSDERTGVPQIRSQRLTMNGQRLWGPSGRLVAPTGMPQSDPDILRLNDDSYVILWTDSRSGGADVYTIRVLADGSPAPGWPATGVALEARPEVASGARLVVGRFAVWEETGARFGGGRQIVARKLGLDGTADPTWPDSGLLASDTPTVDRLQDARSDQGGGVVIAWSDMRAASGSNPTDLYASWITGAGGRRPGWPASGLPICTASGAQDRARVAVHGGGWNVMFAWEDHRGADTHVYVGARTPDGLMPCCEWVADGLPAAPVAGDQTTPILEAANLGGALVAWNDHRSDPTPGVRVYAQAFSVDGRNVDAPAPALPARAALLAPSPNPARDAVRLAAELPRAERVLVEVLDVAGRRLRVLADETRPSGRHDWTWDGRDAAGGLIGPGVFFVRATFGESSATRPLIRLR